LTALMKRQTFRGRNRGDTARARDGVGGTIDKVRQLIFKLAVVFSLCLAALVALGWFCHAYLNWPGRSQWAPWLFNELNASTDGSGPLLSVRVQYWAMLATTLLLPLLALCHRMLSRRPLPAPNLCPRCGYDLRASTGLCPECGSEFPAVERVAVPILMRKSWRKDRAAALWRRRHSTRS
jgi:hypothetical protein